MMLSSNHALDLQAQQLQLKLLSHLSLPSFPQVRAAPNTSDVLTTQWPSLDLMSLVGTMPQKTTLNIHGQEHPALQLPSYPTDPVGNLPSLGLPNIVAPRQLPPKSSMPTLANQQTLAETLRALNNELKQPQLARTTLGAQQQSAFRAFSSATQSAQSTDDGVDTEGDDARSNDEDGDIVSSEADVTIFPRRKQGQDKLGRNRPAIKITRPVLEQLFDIPQKQACKRLGICATVMKRVCRKLGVHKWPYKESMARKQGHMLHRIMAQRSGTETFA